jgi:sarcosine oxidase
MEEREFDVVVVGLGGLGSGAAYWLARGGASVQGLEQFELGHDRGASEDHSRIIRLSYHTPAYVALATRAYEAWAAVEDEAGESLILETGGLDLWPPNAAIPMEDYTTSLEANGVPFEVLDAGEVMRRWSPWRLADDTRGLFQERGGIALAARCNTAHRRLAEAHGATLRDRTHVAGIETSGGEAMVRTDEGEAIMCRRVILTADAWTNELLAPLGTKLPLTITQEQVTYFAAPDLAAFQPERFPIWIWMDDPGFYGFPVYGENGPKIAQDCGGKPTTPETRTFEKDPDIDARVRAFAAEHLPSALGPEIRTRTCLYTLTPDRDFVLDAVPGHPEVLVALGGAHAFKFASVIGRTLAELATSGTTDADLEPFRIDRDLLTQDDPPTSWMV